MSAANTHWVTPVSLAGKHVQLEPLARDHAKALGAAASDGDIWKLWYTAVPAPDQAETYIETALAQREIGKAMAFVVKDAAGDVVGSTRFGNIDGDNRRVEIGWTWYAARVQRTALNTEAKLLLLTHAFETLGAIAVEFRTSWFNHRSRTAIARLGAKQDGVLRNHMIMPDGTRRDTVVFSIIDSEWPAVRKHLQYKLDEQAART
ncbi:MAG TPA: GNAT family N-acetyltransferase [Arenimonas sp.]|nr:GNAT family N-acetyltransferase [Arenimonas sp.]HMB57626.1 GNAT family N-acetyltransferase [Arenimonas sp.]